MKYNKKYNFLLVVLLFIILVTVDLVAQTPAEEWKQLSTKQKSTIHKEWYKARSLDIGYTVAAICWQESSGGQRQVNEDSPFDVGLFGTNVKWYLRENGLKVTKANIEMAKTVLLTEPNVARIYTYKKITDLIVRYNGNFYKVWKKYNGTGTAAHRYSTNLIAPKVQFLQTIFN